MAADIPLYRDLDSKFIFPFGEDFIKINPELINISYKKYGIEVQKDSFNFLNKECIVPYLNVAAYGLGLAASGKSKRIFIAGFDGFVKYDYRHNETEEIFKIFNLSSNLEVISLTDSLYGVKVDSVYSYLK